MIAKASITAVVAVNIAALAQYGGAQAQTVSVYAMGCMGLAELNSTDMAPQLVRALRDCIDQGRLEEAMQLFFAYSVYSEFDLERVVYARQNDAIVDLNNWMFADYPRLILSELRFYSNELRYQDGDYFAETCAALVAAGPPSYQPYYLIGRGVARELETPGWRVAGFDIQATWRQGLAVNGCPTG